MQRWVAQCSPGHAKQNLKLSNCASLSLLQPESKSLNGYKQLCQFVSVCSRQTNPRELDHAASRAHLMLPPCSAGGFSRNLPATTVFFSHTKSASYSAKQYFPLTRNQPASQPASRTRPELLIPSRNFRFKIASKVLDVLDGWYIFVSTTSTKFTNLVQFDRHLISAWIFLPQTPIYYYYYYLRKNWPL